MALSSIVLTRGCNLINIFSLKTFLPNSCSSKTFNNNTPNTRLILPKTQAPTPKETISKTVVCSVRQHFGNSLVLIPSQETSADKQIPDTSTRLEIPKHIETPNTTADNRIVQSENTEKEPHIEPSQTMEEADEFVEDSLIICDNNFGAMNYEADNSSRFVFYDIMSPSSVGITLVTYGDTNYLAGCPIEVFF